MTAPLRDTAALRLLQYADQSKGGDEFVIPADLAALTDPELTQLRDTATQTFDDVYNDGQDLTDEDLEALATLTEGIERITAEQATRADAADERARKAEELAERVRPKDLDIPKPGETEQPHSEPEVETGDPADAPPPDEGGEDPDHTGTPSNPDQVPGETADHAEPAPIAAAARTEYRVNTARARARAAKRQVPPPARKMAGIRDLIHPAGDVTGHRPDQGIDWREASEILAARLDSFNIGTYAAAATAGRHLSQRNGLITITKPIPGDLMIDTTDPEQTEQILTRAANESRLPQGSLVAAGGWCAPSETMYDLVELEGRDGIFSLPEVGVRRGGFSRTLGPDFSEIYANAAGFEYTEAQDMAGTYGVDANGIGNGTVGDKPCIRIDCPEFEEFRLGATGLCIVAGLWMRRGYPEVIARTIRGTLIAHDHRTAGKLIARVVAGSTPVVMPDQGGGALAPVLDAIEKQTEQYRYKHRIPRATTLEAVFPFWVRGMIRTDLAKREDVGFLSVTDAQIASWFSTRGIAPQFVYNWQDLPSNETTFTAWPQSLRFLLYPAGTWIRGTSPIITMDTLYDSQLLGQNDYVALFTEEGWMVVKMSHDSRVVTVPVCPNGAYAAAVQFECDQNVAVTTTTTTAA